MKSPGSRVPAAAGFAGSAAEGQGLQRPAAEGGGPYEDLILLFPFVSLKTARQAFFGEGAAGFMGLRPLPPAPLIA